MKEIFNLLYISLTFYIYYRINLNKNQNLIAAPILFSQWSEYDLCDLYGVANRQLRYEHHKLLHSCKWV